MIVKVFLIFGFLCTCGYLTFYNKFNPIPSFFAQLEVPPMTNYFEEPVKPRRTLRELEREHSSWNPQNGFSPLEKLIIAFKVIQDRDINDNNSYFKIASYHGQPFRRREIGNDKRPYWNSFCNHRNILFPTWHRFYLLEFENALRTVYPEIRLPYWDETSEETKKFGVPKVLTDQVFIFKSGRVIDNPLKTFKLPVAIGEPFITDEHGMRKPNPMYKPKGYLLKRCPFDGRNTREAHEHNLKYQNEERNVFLLNENVKRTIDGSLQSVELEIGDVEIRNIGMEDRVKLALTAENYTVFASTVAGTEKSVEAPHNNMHIGLSGRVRPGQGSVVEGAYGDIGVLDFASFDPVFWFHHAYIDYLFWVWQEKRQSLEIEFDEKLPGSSVNEGQGPTLTQNYGETFSLNTHLSPFKFGGKNADSSQAVDIHKLGYTYSKGSVSDLVDKKVKFQRYDHGLKLRGFINEKKFHGMWDIYAIATAKGKNGKYIEFTVGDELLVNPLMFGHHNCLNCKDTFKEVVISLDNVEKKIIDVSRFHFLLVSMNDEREVVECQLF